MTKPRGKYRRNSNTPRCFSYPAYAVSTAYAHKKCRCPACVVYKQSEKQRERGRLKPKDSIE